MKRITARPPARIAFPTPGPPTPATTLSSSKIPSAAPPATKPSSPSTQPRPPLPRRHPAAVAADRSPPGLRSPCSRSRECGVSTASPKETFDQTLACADLPRCHITTPERSTVSPNKVITTALVSTPIYPLHFLIIAISVGLLVKLRLSAFRAEFARGRERL